MDCFRELGLPWGADERDVRRAYAALIKQYRPESHPAEFARIRDAYEAARRISRMPPGHDAAPEPYDLEHDEPESYELEQDEPADGMPARRESVRIVRTVEDEPASQSPDALISGMMRELDEQVANGDEAESLRAFNAQWQVVSALPLDDQMDYVNALREWVIYSGRAPMRLILAAAERFGWHTQQRDAEHQYGHEGMHRMDMLLELADHYAEVSENPSAYLSIDGVCGKSPPLLASHYGANWAKTQENQWRAVCDHAAMPELGGRLRAVLPRRIQVFWLDIFFTVCVAAATWITVGPVPGWQGWTALAVFSLAALLGPALLRAAGRKLDADSPRQLGASLARRYRNWRAVKRERDGNDAVMTREIIFTFLFAALFIYGVVALSRDGSAMDGLAALIILAVTSAALFVIYSKLAEMEIWMAAALRRLVKPFRHILDTRRGRTAHDPRQRQRRRRQPQSMRIPKLLWSGNIRWWWVALIVAGQLARVLSGH